MALLIGNVPDNLYMTPAEKKLYEFILTELPDYITFGFDLLIDGHELNAVLLLPHIGVFILDIHGGSALRHEDDVFLIEGSHGQSLLFDPRHTQNQKSILKNYLRKNFYIQPFVYQMNCFPLLNIDEDTRQEIFMWEDLFLFADDFVNSKTFLLKLFKYCTNYIEISSEFKTQKIDSPFFDDLDDKTVSKITRHWGRFVPEKDRPSKPPMAFLSYNSNNYAMANLIQDELEEKGIFTWKAPLDVPFGEYYLDHEMNAIQNCDIFLLLLTPTSQISSEVKIEFEAALKNGKKIFPIIFGDFELNEDYSEAFRTIQWRKMESNCDMSFIDEIVDSIDPN